MKKYYEATRDGETLGSALARLVFKQGRRGRQVRRLDSMDNLEPGGVLVVVLSAKEIEELIAGAATAALIEELLKAFASRV